MKIGFTGTRHGITVQQEAQIRAQLQELSALRHNFQFVDEYDEFHHGDCVGADEQAGAIAHDENYYIFIHPPTNSKLRAFSKDYHIILPALPYIQRNHRIVDTSEILIAAPNSTQEQKRSGTWATIRYAWRKSKPIVCIWPNGDYDSDLIT